MRWIKQQHCIIPQIPSLQGIYKQIELAARVCYKSEDRITEDSAEKLVKRLIDSGHYAMLEHGTVYLTIPCSEWDNYEEFTWGYGINPYAVCNDSECDWEKGKGDVYITTNYRVIIENEWEDDLQFMCEPTKYHAKRYSVLLTTSRQIAMELLRHRTMSFAMESTRYCNYSKDRFGGELKFIAPNWLEHSPREPMLFEDMHYIEGVNLFNDLLNRIEFVYNQLTLDYGWKPQQAAVVLPNALKADLMMTGFAKDWSHLFDLRVKGTTGAPHPQMVELMKPVYEEFVKRKYIQQ